MIKHIHKLNAFVTVTTRRANFTDMHFGKFSMWKSKKDYDEGNCKDTVTYANIYLGQDRSYLEIEANRFIDKILPKGRQGND